MKSTGLVFAFRDYIGSAEPPATVLEDESRFGNDGAFLGDGEPDWVQLPSGLWVIDFDNVDDTIKIPHHDSFDVTGDFTSEAWVKLNTVNVDRSIMDRWKAPSSADKNFKLNVFNTNPRLLVRNAANDAETVFTGATVLATYTWYYIVGVNDIDGLMLLYVNGVVDSNTEAGLESRVSANGLWLGTLSTIPFNGQIVGMRHHSRALSAEYIAARFQATRHWFGV